MGSIGRFIFILERRRRISIANNTMSARPPRTQPTIIPTLFKLLDDELWAAADPEVPMILLVDEVPEVPMILPMDEDPEADEVVSSGTSALG